MAQMMGSHGTMSERPPDVKEIDVLWITAGLGCDGDSVSITAATQPSIEEVLMGAIPGLPKVNLHNPVLAYEVGDDFMKYFYQAEQGVIDPFVLVVEGSIPNENLSGEGYWAAHGNDPMTGPPIKTTEWIDRLAPTALAASAMASAREASSAPISLFARAAAALTSPNALICARSSPRPEIGKFSTARWVCARHSASTCPTTGRGSCRAASSSTGRCRSPAAGRASAPPQARSASSPGSGCT